MVDTFLGSGIYEVRIVVLMTVNVNVAGMWDMMMWSDKELSAFQQNLLLPSTIVFCSKDREFLLESLFCQAVDVLSHCVPCGPFQKFLWLKFGALCHTLNPMKALAAAANCVCT